MTRLADLFEDDRATMLHMLDLFIEHTRPMLAQLQQALMQQDWRGAEDLLHRFAGSCSNLGIVQMTALARAAHAALKKNQTESVPGLCQALPEAFRRLCEHTKNLKEAS